MEEVLLTDGFIFGGLFFDPTVTADMVTDAGLVPTVDFLFPVSYTHLTLPTILLV